MSAKIVGGIILLLVLISYIAFYECVEESSKLKISDIQVIGQAPTTSKYRGLVNIYEINHGDSVTLGVTAQNTVKETISRNDYLVGVNLISPDGGDKYWVLPPEQLIGIDLSPKGEVTNIFTVTNRKELPVSGEFRFQAYIKPVGSDEEIAHSACVTIKIIKMIATL